jgi:tripartite-type tricarboxylate transporter receptor subunit TctC
MASKHWVTVAAILVSMVSGGAFAQSYPEKAVQLVVAYPPGGSTDITARILGKALNEKWGRPVIVENRAGASGMIGAQSVVRSPADGYTLLVGYTAEVALNKLLFKDMSYDPDRDLVPVTLLTATPLVLAAHPSVPARSVKELVALAQAKPGSINYASPGIGGQQHLAGEYLAMVTGVKFTHVPYKGTGPAVKDLLGGQVEIMFAAIAPTLPQLRAGKLVALAVTMDRRSPLLPDVPTFQEAGLPGMAFENWFGLFCPRGTPATVIEHLNRDVAAVMRQEGVASALAAQGLEVRVGSPAEFAAFIREETAKYARIVTDARVKVE